MRSRQLTGLVASAVATSVASSAALFVLGAGCASTRESFAEPPPGEADGGDATTTAPFADAAVPCEGLACRQVDCAKKGLPSTTLTGTVRDPAGLRPLYDVLVYVPNGPVDPLPVGVSCNRCATVPSGKPLVSVLTGPDGRFVLENVPAGADVPLVLQIGKWRRRLTVPMFAECRCSSRSSNGTCDLRTTARVEVARRRTTSPGRGTRRSSRWCLSS